MRQRIIYLILRIALSFAFIYSAILGFFFPYDWINYFPDILRNHFPDTVLLNLFGLSELIIAGWILWGRKIFIPSAIACLYLLASIVFNFNYFDELFRNVSILGIALSLAVLSYPRIIPKSAVE